MAIFTRNGENRIDYYYKGRRQRSKSGARRKDAEETLARIRVKIASGDYVAPEDQAEPLVAPSFDAFCREEYLPWSVGQHSPSHHKRPNTIIERHLIPWFARTHLDQIDVRQIDGYLTSRRRDRIGKGKTRRAVSVATTNRELCGLKSILGKAEAWSYITENPASKVKVMKESPKKPPLLTSEEITRLLREMPDPLHALVACALYAGLRRSELFHLRWEDVDYRAGELRVVSRTDHPTKNRETRQIPMSSALADALQRHPRRLGSPYVFANRTGKPYDNVRKSLNKAAERAGIEGGITMHQLRHCFISHCSMASVDPRTLMKWAGHHDLKVTLGYTHVSAEHEKSAIERLRYQDGHYTDTKAG